jgi:23S rRNA (adenine2503-C2)-methyltransferase
MRPGRNPKAFDKTPLLDLTYNQLKEFLTSWGEPSYRADQIWGWLYRSLATDFREMTNLPKELRERLAEATLLRTMKPLEERLSADGLTRKVLFALRDNQTIESVLMHYERRHTACISTQVGCPFGCIFCATGQSGFVRNLTAGEIVEQVLYFAHSLKAKGERVTNVVLMGMGEPLANYEATWQAIETLTHDEGFSLGARRITISTVGLVPGIRRLAEEGTQIGLAVSLHAPTDELRDELVPINRRYPLTQLMAACRYYVERTGRRISFEYALIRGINDSPEQACQLARLVDGLLCHVNLIPLNPVAESPYQPSPQGRIVAFQAELNRSKVPNTLRVERGIDIQAGCGQLRCQRMPKE